MSFDCSFCSIRLLVRKQQRTYQQGPRRVIVLVSPFIITTIGRFRLNRSEVVPRRRTRVGCIGLRFAPPFLD